MYDYIMNRESLKRHCEKTCKKFKYVPESGIYGEHRLVLDLLEQTEWIPVSERLPDIDEEVLVDDGMDLFVAWFEDDGLEEGWHSFDGSYDPERTILAWMPLPKPYKAESEVE